MLEDPWANCYQFNGTNAPESQDEANSKEIDSHEPKLDEKNFEPESSVPNPEELDLGDESDLDASSS